MQKPDKGILAALKSMGRDLWVLLLDVVAVNAAYFLALLIRFYVNGVFRPTVSHYLSDFAQIAPFYTVACIIVFALFRLYSGMWRYAGINDMNRIICASLVTTALQLVTALWHRMPITYYVIGAVLQFIFIVIIRFAYRFLLVEKKKMASRRLPAVNVAVVGASEMARRAIHQLDDSVYRPVCVIDCGGVSQGAAMDGVPILGGADQLADAVGRYAAGAVIVADPSLSEENRQAIQRLCEEKRLEMRNYTGLLSNLSGRLSLAALLESAKGPVQILLDGRKTGYADGLEALSGLNDRYSVTAVSAEDGSLLIEIRENRGEAYAGYEAWVEKHREETGEEVSYF